MSASGTPSNLFDVNNSKYKNANEPKPSFLRIPSNNTDYSANDSGFDASHLYHFVCLKNWLESHEKCPVCYTMIDESITSAETFAYLKESSCPEVRLISQLIIEFSNNSICKPDESPISNSAAMPIKNIEVENYKDF